MAATIYRQYKEETDRDKATLRHIKSWVVKYMLVMSVWIIILIVEAKVYLNRNFLLFFLYTYM